MSIFNTELYHVRAIGIVNTDNKAKMNTIGNENNSPIYLSASDNNTDYSELLNMSALKQGNNDSYIEYESLHPQSISINNDNQQFSIGFPLMEIYLESQNEKGLNDSLNIVLRTKNTEKMNKKLRSRGAYNIASMNHMNDASNVYNMRPTNKKQHDSKNIILKQRQPTNKQFNYYRIRPSIYM